MEFKKALSILTEKGMKGLILDLRFNGGGYLHQATNVADEFLEKNKLIVYTEGAIQKKERSFQLLRAFKNGKLIILVNSTTASASEIVSGAIQDHEDYIR